jgi:hypothetical protein
LIIAHTQLSAALRIRNRRDSESRLMPLAANGGEFVVRAEAAKRQQRRGEQSHRQREDEDERDQQSDGPHHQPERRLPADEQGEDFFGEIPEQQHEGEHGDDISSDASTWRVR